MYQFGAIETTDFELIVAHKLFLKLRQKLKISKFRK